MLGSFNLGKMTFGSIFKKPETIQYPAQTRFVPEGLKGHIDITIEDCIFCGICQKCCPADAIVVDKPATSWSIDVFRCVQCGSCVRQCPQSCLAMLPDYAPTSPTKSIHKVVRPADSEEDAAAKEAKEAEKAARVKAALAAKAAREQNKA